jgi:hypothetical protein
MNLNPHPPRTMNLNLNLNLNAANQSPSSSPRNCNSKRRVQLERENPQEQERALKKSKLLSKSSLHDDADDGGGHCNDGNDGNDGNDKSQETTTTTTTTDAISNQLPSAKIMIENRSTRPLVSEHPSGSKALLQTDQQHKRKQQQQQVLSDVTANDPSPHMHSSTTSTKKGQMQREKTWKRVKITTKDVHGNSYMLATIELPKATTDTTTMIANASANAKEATTDLLLVNQISYQSSTDTKENQGRGDEKHHQERKQQSPILEHKSNKVLLQQIRVRVRQETTNNALNSGNVLLAQLQAQRTMTTTPWGQQQQQQQQQQSTESSRNNRKSSRRNPAATNAVQTSSSASSKTAAAVGQQSLMPPPKSRQAVSFSSSSVLPTGGHPAAHNIHQPPPSRKMIRKSAQRRGGDILMSPITKKSPRLVLEQASQITNKIPTLAVQVPPPFLSQYQPSYSQYHPSYSMAAEATARAPDTTTATTTRLGMDVGNKHNGYGYRSSSLPSLARPFSPMAMAQMAQTNTQLIMVERALQMATVAQAMRMAAADQVGGGVPTSNSITGGTRSASVGAAFRNQVKSPARFFDAPNDPTADCTCPTQFQPPQGNDNDNDAAATAAAAKFFGGMMSPMMSQPTGKTITLQQTTSSVPQNWSNTLSQQSKISITIPSRSKTPSPTTPRTNNKTNHRRLLLQQGQQFISNGGLPNDNASTAVNNHSHVSRMEGNNKIIEKDALLEPGTSSANHTCNVVVGGSCSNTNTSPTTFGLSLEEMTLFTEVMRDPSSQKDGGTCDDEGESMEPKDADVLCSVQAHGDHYGNKLFRTIVGMQVARYRTSSEERRLEIARSVVKSIHSHFRGNFLVWNSEFRRWERMENHNAVDIAMRSLEMCHLQQERWTQEHKLFSLDRYPEISFPPTTWKIKDGVQVPRAKRRLDDGASSSPSGDESSIMECSTIRCLQNKSGMSHKVAGGKPQLFDTAGKEHESDAFAVKKPTECQWAKVSIDYALHALANKSALPFHGIISEEIATPTIWIDLQNKYCPSIEEAEDGSLFFVQSSNKE